MSPPSAEQVTQALDGVQDPEIHRPITELGMVKNVNIGADGAVLVEVYLTVAGCPLRETITRDVTTAVGKLPGVSSVRVQLDVMSDEQRRALQTKLRGGREEPQIPFAQPTSLTRVYAVASGKGGVGKSSVTVNLAAALAASGQKVGVVDADIYGHSVPRMLGVTGRPTPVENMIMPPSAHGVKVISIGMFTKGNTPVVWRGPMLHRALQQFLADVYWGDLDVLLLDLPPGTGDVAISVAQMLPVAELLVVTTPQLAAAEVAERAGAIASQTHQRVAGVIENMSYLVCAHCGEQTEVFGSGGGATVAAALSRIGGTQVPLLGQVPLDVRLREGGDAGMPLVLSDPDSPAALALRKIADEIGARGRGLAGRHLGLTPGRPRSTASGKSGAVGGGALGQVASGSNGGRSPGASSVPLARGWAGAAADAFLGSLSPLTSSKRCFCMNRFGFRSSISKSANSGPSPSRRSFLAPSAILRRSRRARPAWEAILGSSCGPKMTSAITARTSSLGMDRSNTAQLSVRQVNTRTSTLNAAGAVRVNGTG